MAASRKPKKPKKRPGKKVRKRDYKAEYRRRVARAIELGVSRAAARGHAKRGEFSVRDVRRIAHAATSLDHAYRIQVARMAVKRSGAESPEEFYLSVSRFGISRHEAYSLWFSP